jgi:hypothetical protein
VGDAGSDAGRLDESAFLDSYRSVVERSCPAALPDALRLWARLGPDRWPLEWRLPVWLGDAFGLDRAVSTAISLANVLGLASVRLRDDLVDGDVDETDRPTAELLADVLYRAALDVHRRWFRPSDPFWGRVEAWMAEWTAATMRSTPDAPGRGAAEDRRALAERGAPLKVSALAVCLLTDRERDFARIDGCLGHALTAIVLYDDACDWEADLAAGRWNAFAVAASRTAARRGGAARLDGPDVLAGLIATGSVGPYFSRILRELGLAAAIAREMGVVPLAAFFSDLAERFDAEARTLDRRYDSVGETAAGLVFGPGWRDRSRAGPVPGTA